MHPVLPWLSLGGVTVWTVHIYLHSSHVRPDCGPQSQTMPCVRPGWDVATVPGWGVGCGDSSIIAASSAQAHRPGPGPPASIARGKTARTQLLGSQGRCPRLPPTVPAQVPTRARYLSQRQQRLQLFHLALGGGWGADSHRDGALRDR